MTRKKTAGSLPQLAQANRQEDTPMTADTDIASTFSSTPPGIAMRLADTLSPAEIDLLAALAPKGALPLWQAFIRGPVKLRSVEQGRVEAGGTEIDAHNAFLLVAMLWAHQSLVLASEQDDPALEIFSGGPGEALNLGVCQMNGIWQATRFASLLSENGAGSHRCIAIENPLSTVQTNISQTHAPRVAALFASLMAPYDLSRIVRPADAEANAGGSVDDILFLLAVAGIISRVDDNGRFPEECDETLRQWEHHDLLFHFRSRQGRHMHEMGAGFRFKGDLDPQPALKDNPWRDRAIVLPRPDLSLLAACDPPFTAVLEARRSIRSHSMTQPINLATIAEFLYRSARVRGSQQTEIGEFTSRPYPSGGASYELEIYLSVNYAADLARGFYYYDPQAHTLCMIRPANADMEALLDDAWISAARTCRPQVLITIASRFQRVSWKYSGMAYAAQMKNLGVLYQTFYLVATAMNLAGCGLGLGNANRFCRLAGTDYLVESSIGEFMLGTPS